MQGGHGHGHILSLDWWGVNTWGLAVLLGTTVTHDPLEMGQKAFTRNTFPANQSHRSLAYPLTPVHMQFHMRRATPLSCIWIWVQLMVQPGKPLLFKAESHNLVQTRQEGREGEKKSEGSGCAACIMSFKAQTSGEGFSLYSCHCSADYKITWPCFYFYSADWKTKGWGAVMGIKKTQKCSLKKKRELALKYSLLKWYPKLCPRQGCIFQLKWLSLKWLNTRI